MPLDPQVNAPPAAILVVDDHPQNLLAMQALLARDGLQVVTAASGPEALEALLAQDFAVALLDVQMPGMDGFELAETMRGTRRTRGIPIVFLTAGPGDPQRVFRGYETGAVDYLHKPVDNRVLRGKVDVFVELWRQRRLLADGHAELQRVLDLQETMLAVLTHDLRTPLSAVMMGAEWLRRQPDPVVQRTAERIRGSGSRMSRLITELLEFARLRSGTLRLDRRPVDLRRLVEQAAGEIQAADPQAVIAFEADGDCTLQADESRLGQVFANLIGNAVEHGQRRCRVMLHGDDGCVGVRVCNRGDIAAAVRAHLFEPYKRTSARGEGHAGLGLGLYIVDQFVRAHGGTVSVRTDDGEVCFRVTIPRGATADGCAGPGGTGP